MRLTVGTSLCSGVSGFAGLLGGALSSAQLVPLEVALVLHTRRGQ